MADIVALGIVVAFFAVLVAYLRWCDRIVGPDPAPHDTTADSAMTAADETEVPA